MHLIRLQLFLFILSLSFCVQAQISLSSEREDQIYKAGEEMNFIITSPSSTTVNYQITFDTRTSIIESGTIAVQAGQESLIPFVLDEPGTVIFEASDGINAPQQLGVAFSPFAIGIYEECPADFDAFWADQINQLAVIPIDPELSILQSTAANVTYRVNLATVDNRRVYGYITIPNGTGPFPAVLTLPPNGAGPNNAVAEAVVSEKVGAISMSISIHNVEPDEIDPNANQPDVTTLREGYYYRTSILAGIRAIDYIFTRSDFDGENLVVTGVSQGGGLGMAVSSLDTRVKAMTISNPALCEHAGFKYNRASGFPYYNWSGSGQNTANIDPAVLEASKYYDTKYFAQRYDRPCLFTTGYRDVICPTTTVFGATNQLRGHKLIVHALSLEHQSPVEYWEGRFNFWVLHVPAFANSIFSQNTPKARVANAGADFSGSANQALSLSGNTMMDNTLITTWPVRWELLDGPGNVKFGDAGQRNTSVEFDQPGTYTLRFSAEDSQLVTSDRILFTVQDHITITIN